MLGSRHPEARSYRGMATVFLVFLQCRGLLVRLFYSIRLASYLAITVFLYLTPYLKLMASQYNFRFLVQTWKYSITILRSLEYPLLSRFSTFDSSFSLYLPLPPSLGDRYLKPWIIPEPEVMFVPRSREDDCLVLASDGLWDVMSNEEVCEVARKRILIWHKRNGTDPLVDRGQGVDPAAQSAAEYLCHLAIQAGSKDNISIIVIDLKAKRKIKTKP